MYTGTAGKAWFTSSVHPFPLIFFFSGFTMTSMQHAGCGSVSADLQTMKTCQLSGLYHFSLLRRRGKGRCQTVQQFICFLSEILTLPFFRLQPFCVSQRTPLLGCAHAHTHTELGRVGEGEESGTRWMFTCPSLELSSVSSWR